MFFIKTFLQSISLSKNITDLLSTNMSLIFKYVVNEAKVLKFSLESSIVKKNTNSAQPLLEFFKRNCFFRDYIYLWQNWKGVNTSQLDKPTQYIRFELTGSPSTTITTTIKSNSLLSLVTLKQVGTVFSSLLPTAGNIRFSVLWNKLTAYGSSVINKSFSFGFFYIQGFAFILFIDACLTDDEPLWEPIEWSLVQTWILFIFSFAWIAENLIVSRYGSYTGRDKRVWFSWYKTFWLIEGYYVINYGVACVFVIVPFYFETNYNLSFVYSWWHWYSRVFFFKFISVFTIILFISYYLQMSVRWLNWKKGLILILLINIFLSYLIYTQFIMTFFGYFTDPVWYQKTRPVDYIQLSHEPARWGWGSAKKDHFTYHNVKTVFWFKNDGPFAASFLFFQTFLFVCIFMLYIYWITLFRRVYAMKEIPLTYTTYCVSSLKQFFYFFLMFYIMIFLSYIFNYSRFPIEFLWTLDTQSWFYNFTQIMIAYPSFLISIFW